MSKKKQMFYIYKSKIMERGWSTGMIKKFLGDPDHTQKIGYGRTISNYIFNDVEKQEQTTSFKTDQDKFFKRRNSALKSCKIKKEALLEEMNNFKISIEKIPVRELVKRSIAAYNHYWEYNHENKFASTQDCPIFLERICINYIRHNYEKYEKKLNIIVRKVGCQDAYQILKIRINEEINSIYNFRLSDSIREEFPVPPPKNPRPMTKETFDRIEQRKNRKKKSPEERELRIKHRREERHKKEKERKERIILKQQMNKELVEIVSEYGSFTRISCLVNFCGAVVKDYMKLELSKVGCQ